jgi:hypothetical protein
MAVLLPFAAVLAMLCMTSGDAWDVGVVGGGAAGFFSAVECARVMPKGTGTVTVFEGLKVRDCCVCTYMHAHHIAVRISRSRCQRLRSLVEGGVM